MYDISRMRFCEVAMRISGLYFSPTRETQKVVVQLVARLNEETFDSKEMKSSDEARFFDFTPMASRAKSYEFTSEDLVVIGFPVYAGRLPNVLKKDLRHIEANGAKAIIVVTYGNRSPGDALLELYDEMTLSGFEIIAACARVAKHPFSPLLGANRPWTKEETDLRQFLQAIKEKLTSKNHEAMNLKRYEIGLGDVGPYYKPKNQKGEPVSLLKVIPEIDKDKCSLCGLCICRCPMDSLAMTKDAGNPRAVYVSGICIKCHACVVACPEKAIAFTDPNFIDHKKDLENRHSSPKSSKWYV